MTCGYVSLAYGEDTGATTIFRGHDLTEFTADTITVTGGEYAVGLDFVDADALTEYITGLSTQEMTGNYSYPDNGPTLSIWYNSPYGVVLVDLQTEYIKVIYLSDEEEMRDTSTICRSQPTGNILTLLYRHCQQLRSICPMVHNTEGII